MGEIIDYNMTTASINSDNFILEKDIRQVPNNKTKVQIIFIRRKDGSTLWEGLKYLKQYNFIELSDYDVVNNMIHETVFEWWFHWILRNQYRIIKVPRKQ